MGEYAAMAVTMGESFSKFSGQRREADALEAQGAYEKSQYDFNATLASRQAADALERGDVAASRERTTTRAVIGAGRAASAAQGVEVGTGSEKDVEANTARLGEIDAVTIENNAAREAWGYRVQEEDYTAKGRMALFAGQQRAAGLRTKSVGTLLTGAAETYGLWKDAHPQIPEDKIAVPGGTTSAASWSRLDSAVRARGVSSTSMGTAPPPVKSIPLKPIRKFPWEGQ